MKGAPEPQTLRSVIAECMAKFKGDRAKVRRCVVAKIKEDDALLAEIIDPLIAEAVGSATRSAVGSSNRAIAGRRDDASARDSADGASWYDYLLPNGTKLGAAKRGDVQDAANVHATQARANAHKAAWLTAIAERLNESAQVRSAFTEPALGALYEKVRK